MVLINNNLTTWNSSIKVSNIAPVRVAIKCTKMPLINEISISSSKPKQNELKGKWNESTIHLTLLRERDLLRR